MKNVTMQAASALNC